MSQSGESKAKTAGRLLWRTISAPVILLGQASNAAFPKCGNCNKRLGRLSNMAKPLAQNFTEHKMPEEPVLKHQFLCQRCFEAHSFSRCSKTGQIFRSRDDRSAEFRSSQMCQNLSPHHPSSQVYGALSPDGLAAIDREHQELQSRFRRWAGCSKQDVLRGHRITKELKLIRSDDGYDDPAGVEEALKWHCLQIGGNGLIKFFWDKHIRHHEGEYVAGYGKNGNPYYRTRRWTTADFSGHAVAVLAESTSPASRPNRTKEARDDKETSQPSEADYWNILGLSGNITKEDIRKAYRKAMSEYHPDKVASLGPELRALAEKKAKEINQAYDFFRKRYGV